MYKPILVVPDVHGRNFWEPALKYEGEVIFLGDYVDPYPSEGINAPQALETFKKIIDFKRQNLERVTLLTGNHELHYYDTQYRCTRFSHFIYDEVHAILTSDETKDYFNICRKVDNVIFIHAGILKGWHDRHAERLADLGESIDQQLNKLFEEDKEPFGEVSQLYRGGNNDFGSPLWADFREIRDEPEAFEPECLQVIGHTQFLAPEPLVHKNVRLIDNRKLYILEEGIIRHF